jgi:hypothetical protein
MLRRALADGVSPQRAFFDDLRETQPQAYTFVLPMTDPANSSVLILVALDMVLAGVLMVFLGGMLAIGGEIIGVAFAIEKNTHAVVEILRKQPRSPTEARERAIVERDAAQAEQTLRVLYASLRKAEVTEAEYLRQKRVLLTAIGLRADEPLEHEDDDPG